MPRDASLSSYSSESSADDEMSLDETPPRRRRSQAPRRTRKLLNVIKTMLHGTRKQLKKLTESHVKLTESHDKLTESHVSLREQLGLHNNNGTSGHGGSAAQRSSLSNQVQPRRYELEITSGNIGVQPENLNNRNSDGENKINYKIRIGQTIDITVTLLDRTDGDRKIVENGPLASATLEFVVLDDKAFIQHIEQSNYWSIEEFERCIKTTTTKQNPAQRESVKVSNSRFNLIRGVGSHTCSINKNSSNSKFRLAVRVASSTTERVLETFSNPFYVRDPVKRNKQKKRRMVDSDQGARITMNASEEQPELPCQGSSEMYSAQQYTTNAEQTVIGQYHAAPYSQMWAQTRNNQAVNTSEEQPQLPVTCHASSAMYSAQPRITSEEQVLTGQYQSALRSPMSTRALNSQAAMYTSEDQRQLIEQGNSAIYCTPPYTSQEQGLAGQYQFSQWTSLDQATSSQIGTSHNCNRNETALPLRILWDRPNVELSKPCWNIHDYLMLRQRKFNNCGSLSTTRLIPEQLGSLTVTPKEIMQTACRKRGVRIESLEPDDSDEERPLKRKLHSKYRLRFVNKVCEAYYTWGQIKADDGNLLKVALFDENNTKITSGPVSSASVEVVVLHGDFNIAGQDSWTSEEFARSVVCPQPGNLASVLGGDLTLVLAHGEACLGDAFFQIASFCARTEKFKLGVRLASFQEERIQEGMSESFLVKDHPFADAAWNPHGQGANNDYLPFHLSPGTLRLSKMSLVDENMNIKFHMLEAITNNFADEMKVGSGTFGTVYKGKYNGQEIAVKKLHPLKGLDDTAFDNELRSLCKIRHQNVIRLLGYCHESRKILTHKGQKIADREMERALCFEYVEHGSLEKHISDNPCDLDWQMCFKIIKGICEGLNHLHSAQEKPIYHLDLKPSNILLAEDLTPKIADFGLSTLFASTETYKTKTTRGTLRYMPPEYIDSGTTSRKFDVFSLGVIIIEILAGNRGYSRSYEMPQKQFTELVTIYWKGKLLAMSGYSSREINIQQVNTCINMALRCVNADRNRRPYIEDIVNEVKEIEAKIVKMSLYSAQSTDLTGVLNKRMMVEFKEEMHNLGKVVITTLKEEFKEERKEICKRSKKLSREIHKKTEKITESVNNLSKQLELHINDTSGDESAASRPQSSQVQPPRYRLVFKSGVAETIEKGQTIEISVALIDVHNDQTVENGPLASATVQLVVVNAEFNQHNNQYNWSREDFQSNIKKAQGNSATVDVDQSVKSIVSDGQFNLVQGFKCHRGSTIVRNSSNKKVRLGVMVVSPREERVLEGLSNPFFVRGHDRPRSNPAAATLQFPRNTVTEAIQQQALIPHQFSHLKTSSGPSTIILPRNENRYQKPEHPVVFTPVISQIQRAVDSQLQRYVDRTFHKYHEMISSKLESFQEQLEGLRHEVARLSRPYSNHYTDQQTRLVEANQERIAANGSNTNTRLCFLNGLVPPVYTDENLTSQNHAAIKLAMFEGDKVVTSGALSKAKIEILVLRGDFSNKCRDNWTEDEFDKHILQGRDGHDLVLGTVWLTNGMAELTQIRFREGSSRKNVIMAARVSKNIKTSGRVQEAIMKPVKVLDRRNKQNEKRHPPRLDDDLYRLEEIPRDGAYHKRLQEVQIHNVEGFLKALNEDSNKLRAILKMENQQNAWSKLTEHARQCVLEDRQELKRYHSKEGNVVLFFNCVHELVGAAFPHEYVACQRFNTAQKALVNKWRLHAYEKLNDISPDFVMKGNIPEPVSSSTDVAAALSVLAVGASQQVFSANQLAPYQGTGAAEYLAHNERVMGQISPIANCGPTIPNNGPNTHYYQGTGTAENLPQGEHGIPYQIADCGPIVADPDYLNTRYCQDQGIPLHGQQQVISPWTQNPQGMMDFACPIELTGMNFDLYQDSGASTSAQAQLMFGPRNPTQPESTSPAAAPPRMSSIAEQDQGPNCSGFPRSGHPNDFQ